MKYLSEYGNKVFDSEYECLEYENREKKHLEEERRKQLYDKLICIEKTCHELEELISEFDNIYGTMQEKKFSPIDDILETLDTLCR